MDSGFGRRHVIDTTSDPIANSRVNAERDLKIAVIDAWLFSPDYDWALVDALRGLGHEVRLCTSGPCSHGESSATEALASHTLDPLTLSLLPWLSEPPAAWCKALLHPAVMRTLVRALRDWGPDVIHFQWTPFPLCDQWFLPALRRIAPIVCTVHDVVPFNGNPTSALQKVGAVDILRDFDAVVAHTRRSSQYLASLLPGSQKVCQIAHGLLHAGAVSGGPSSATDPTSGNKLVILFFGKIKPYKGLDTLIRAVSLLPARLHCRVGLRIVGKPYMDTHALKALAESLRVTHMIDFQFRFVASDQIPAMLQSASVIVLPYREVDASGVLMTALAAGRPIVATKVGAMAELLTHGQDALLVQAGDAAGLAGALTQVLEDDGIRLSLSEGARRLQASIPTWPDIGRETVALYLQVIDPTVRTIKHPSQFASTPSRREADH